MIFLELMDYRDVFDKKKAERFSKPRPWDHTIDLKPDFAPKDCKVYPFTPQEHTEMDKLMRTLQKDTSNPQNLLWHLLSSL